MTLQDELLAFYARSGFGPTVGARPLTVKVYTGCMLVPLPNIETRSRCLKYHDLHHLVTGYSTGRIGEGEVSAWELGTGSMAVSPTLGMMNLIALSTGLVLQPKRMWKAYARGCSGSNLYRAGTRADVDAGRWQDLAALRTATLDISLAENVPLLRRAEFGAYCAAAMLVHAAIAVPAVVLRFITDVSLGGSVFEAVKPKKRADLY